MTEEMKQEFSMFLDYWNERQRSLNTLWHLQDGHATQLVNHRAEEFFGDLLTKGCAEFDESVRQLILSEQRVILYDLLDKIKRVMTAPDTSRKYAGSATLREVVTTAIAETAGKINMLRVLGINPPIDGVQPFWRDPIVTIHGLADQIIAVYERDHAPETEEDNENRKVIIKILSEYITDPATDLSPLVGARTYPYSKWVTSMIESSITLEDHLAMTNVLDNYRLIQRVIRHE